MVSNQPHSVCSLFSLAPEFISGIFKGYMTLVTGQRRATLPFITCYSLRTYLLVIFQSLPA